LKRCKPLGELARFSIRRRMSAPVAGLQYVFELIAFPLIK
jgi:hypothetical protein